MKNIVTRTSAKLKSLLKLTLCAGLTAASLSACGQAQMPPLVRMAPTGLQRFSAPAATASGPVNIGFFYGMDDYNGQTQPEVQNLHQQLSAVGSNPRFDLYLSADSDVKGDGFRTRVTQNQPWNDRSFLPVGELDTGSNPALRDFLGWMGKSRPAPATWLNLSSHGGGYRGIMYDYDGNISGPYKNLSLQQTFKALSKGYTGSRIDALNFDACMMASIEVGEALKGTVKAFAASEDFSFGGSIPWQPILAQMPAGANGEVFLRALVDKTIRQGNHGAQGSQTWSAIRLNRDFDVLVAKVDRLADALLRRMKTAPAEVSAAAKATHMFASMAEYASHYGDYYQRDLIEFCQILQRSSADPILQRSAADVIAAVRPVIIAEAHGPKQTMANGLAIYLPLDGRFDPQYSRSIFAQHTRWDEFLMAMNQFQMVQGAPQR